MLTLSSVQLNIWLATFFWPFCRVAALMAASPMYGALGVPNMLKVVIAFAITVVVSPVLPPMPAVSPTSAQGMLIMMQQLMIGYGMGMVVRLAFSAMEMGGHVMGLQMGLGFATFFDPQNGTQVPLLGQFLGIMAMLLFLSFNGHLMIIAALVESFHTLPVGEFMAIKSWKALALAGGNIFSWGLLISLPVLAAVMMANAALGVLTRAAPQLNIFAVGFPITLGLGFVVLAYSLPYFLPLFQGMIDQSINTMLMLVKPGG
jgi:flagellar biosynthetic protein FliR